MTCTSATGVDDQSPAERRRVLIVDDDADIRLLLQLALEADGRFLVVAQAVNGSDAIEAAVETQPDVIILDHLMPVMTGLEALPSLRGAAPAAKVAMFSATIISDVPDGDASPDLVVKKDAPLPQVFEAILAS